MSVRPKILLLDDEQDLLDLYRDLLAQLPSQPEIHLANSGARAIALLESDPFTMLISDLRMPKMDGLQVLSIVRSRFPDLRVVVMTSIVDEQYRSRAYAMGVDLFWVKPTNAEEMKMFQDCIASLLGRDTQPGGGGFRGVQSKSLVDIIQLECLSHSSSILKIVNGPREGKLWVRDGELIDAQCGELNGHAAFKEILSWKTGAFEILPPESERTRTIFDNYQGLLLDSVQASDELQGTMPEATAEHTEFLSALSRIARIEGVEFVVQTAIDGQTPVESWGMKNAEAAAAWSLETWKKLNALAEKIQAGQLKHLQGFGWQGHIDIEARDEKRLFCIGFKRALSSVQVREIMKKIHEKWAS